MDETTAPSVIIPITAALMARVEAEQDAAAQLNKYQLEFSLEQSR